MAAGFLLMKILAYTKITENEELKFWLNIEYLTKGCLHLS